MHAQTHTKPAHTSSTVSTRKKTTKANYKFTCTIFPSEALLFYSSRQSSLSHFTFFRSNFLASKFFRNRSADLRCFSWFGLVGSIVEPSSPAIFKVDCFFPNGTSHVELHTFFLKLTMKWINTRNCSGVMLCNALTSNRRKTEHLRWTWKCARPERNFVTHIATTTFFLHC